jgi:hypothetical protein
MDINVIHTAVPGPPTRIHIEMLEVRKAPDLAGASCGAAEGLFEPAEIHRLVAF